MAPIWHWKHVNSELSLQWIEMSRNVTKHFTIVSQSLIMKKSTKGGIHFCDQRKCFLQSTRFFVSSFQSWNLTFCPQKWWALKLRFFHSCYNKLWNCKNLVNEHHHVCEDKWSQRLFCTLNEMSNANHTQKSRKCRTGNFNISKNDSTNHESFLWSLWFWNLHHKENLSKVVLWTVCF